MGGVLIDIPSKNSLKDYRNWLYFIDMISSVTWIPRGAARSRPVKYELSAAEFARVQELARLEGESEEAQEAAESGSDDDSKGEEAEDAEGESLPAEYGMDHYDSDPESGLGGANPDIDIETSAGNGDGLAVIDQGGTAFAVEAESDDEDAEDNEIHPTDALLVVAMTEDEFSHLEVQVLAEDGNMFVHHDIQLPEFPLCTAWMDCPPFQSQGGQQTVGSYIAVGSFNPAIEIWNLDVLDPLEPTAVLGGEIQEDYSSKSKKGKKKRIQKVQQGPVLKEGSHQDAVMSLSWNKVYRQALASGSADSTVKIWDVTTQACSHTFSHHKGKVQSVLFHPSEAWRLATGSYDKTVALLDCRSGSLSTSYKVAADMESMAWDPFQPHHLYAALENGLVVCIDVRQTDPLFSFQAHNDTVSSLSFSAGIPGFLCTASEDKTIKVWDVESCQSGRSKVPVAVAYKSMNVGKLFTLQFYPDNPFLLATGGDAGMVAVWESDEMQELNQRFASRVHTSDNAYLSLPKGEIRAAPAASEIAIKGTNAGVTADEDDSWMDDSTGVATAGVEKKKKRKKEKKVAKSRG